MALRGKKPTTIEKRLKCMFYGAAGSGKTTAAIQFPKPYLIDTERGAENEQYAALLEKTGGMIFQTADFDEMIQEVQELLKSKHQFRTVIIDPITTVYNDLIEKAERKVGTEFGRHYGEANKHMRHLVNLLLRLDMNVIVTCHAKDQYGDGMAKLGQTFDGWKKLDYLFDLVFEVQKRGPERVGIVRKTRIETFTEGDVFPFNYAEVAKRYGSARIEKEATPETLATEDQIKRLTHLLGVLKIDEETTQKWLDKAMAETWAEMPADAMDKCIKHLESKLEGAAA